MRFSLRDWATGPKLFTFQVVGKEAGVPAQNGRSAEGKETAGRKTAANLI
jgi:hypothetical protein